MSKYVREIDSIQELRRTPTSDAAAAHVRTPTGRGGIFVPMTADPFGRGEDGAVALQASDGTWWAREEALENDRARPEWWGAARDGTTDDSSAIQSASDWASSNGAEVHLSAGTYLIEAPIDLTSLENLVVSGRGMGKTEIRAGLGFTAGTPMFDVRQPSDARTNLPMLESLFINGNGTGAHGAFWKFSHHVLGRDLLVRNCDIGVQAGQCWLGRWENVKVLDCTIGAIIKNRSNEFSNDRCAYNSCSDWCVRVESEQNDCQGVNFYDTDWEAASGAGIYLDPGPGRTVFITNCYSEKLKGGPNFQHESGLIRVLDSHLIYGETSSNNLVEQNTNTDPIDFDNCDIGNAGAIPRLEGIADDATASGAETLTITQSIIRASQAGINVYAGAPFGRYTKGRRTFLQDGHPRGWEVITSGSTSVTTTRGDNYVDVLIESGSLFAIRHPINDFRRDGQLNYLVDCEVDASVSPFARLTSGGPINGSPRSFSVDLPNSGGARQQVLKLDLDAQSGDFQVFSVILDGGNAGDRVRIYDAHVSVRRSTQRARTLSL